MKIITFGKEPKQKITILFEDTSIIIEIRYRPTIQSWTIDITFRDEVLVSGKRLTAGLMLLKQFNKPFDITLKENQKTGLDPFLQDDFEKRFTVFLFEREDVKELRGYDVI